MTDDLVHYGTLHKSGRYPWGSGENPNQHSKEFLDYVEDLRKKGMSEPEIARGLGMTTTELRNQKSIAKTTRRTEDMAEAMRLKERGYSNVAIGQKMGINESSVRALLDPASQRRNDVLESTADILKKQVGEKEFIDIGLGTESHLGVSRTKLNTAVAKLKDEGYKVYYVKTRQVGTGKDTSIKVLAAPGTAYVDVSKHPEKIQVVGAWSNNGGLTYEPVGPPKSLSSKRVGIKYAEDGGADSDGMIYVRRGVEDVSLGSARYAQVRVMVDGTHYIKGMAIYKDDLPDGVDVEFHTNKSRTANKHDALKSIKDDPENPFGSTTRQIKDSKGKVTSVMNVVNEEGNWHNWSRNLSSQMLSKQQPALIKQQLDLTFASKKAEFDEIMALTNPTVRKKLLEKFADGADSSAVHLKAAGLPRTRNHVILPITTMKDTEIYAPNYRDGEKVVLIRHPHGGVFEIPELTVNNRHKDAKRTIGSALDAVGISPKTAQQLSGADFDGDTVLVIPNNSRAVKTASPLSELKGFDPKASYPAYPGMKPMSPRAKQQQMGDVSNLITDMTIKGAPHADIARAVKHSMVVIDAEKHNLDYRQSSIDNGIRELKTKYQGGPRSGASTIISRASSTIRVPERVARKAEDGGPINKATGELRFTPTGNQFVNKKGQTVFKTSISTPMAETSDARKLVSSPVGTPQEMIYANHANQLKAIANQARKEAYSTKGTPYSPSAKTAYSSEVASLNAKLNVAVRNKPLERQAQLVANASISAKRQANPNMGDDELKKVKSQAINEARRRTGAQKHRVDITQAEWDAIQAGAISNTKLNDILDNADIDTVKKLATPRTSTGVTAPQMARAKAMLSAGYTQAEIADALGVPTSTLNDNLMKEG